MTLRYHDGHYKSYQYGKLLASFNICDNEFYGECIYYSQKNKKYVCEMFNNNYGRCVCYNERDQKLYKIASLNNDIKIVECYCKKSSCNFRVVEALYKLINELEM